MKFPIYTQLDAMDCGPTCLRMVTKFYGKDHAIGKIRSMSGIGRAGVSMLGISQAAEMMGFKTLAVKITVAQLLKEAPLPCILHWNQNHFVVLPPQRGKGNKILVADPANGLVKMERSVFEAAWLSDNNSGVALLLEPQAEFYSQDDDDVKKVGWSSLLTLLLQHRSYFGQILLGLVISNLLQLIFPFLTQSVIDTGISTGNLSFINVLLAAQFMLFFGRASIEFIRGRLLVFVSTRINITLLTGFWFKLMRLPLSYFDTKQTGDLQQRIRDQHQLESFLTGSSLSVVFSIFNLIIFSVVLLLFNQTIFFVFAIGNILYFGWVRVFLKFRRDLNYRRFSLSATENSSTLQLIYGMQEIRLNNAEQFFRWKWEHIQARLFKLNFKALSQSQVQQAGALFLNEGKNILITFLVARLVVQGQLTIGSMLAIQYIIGQLNSPVEQLIGFSQTLQDAKISLERLNEIQQVADEEPHNSSMAQTIEGSADLEFQNVSFRYPGAGEIPVLQDISVVIPARKVTAIVGTSGSGKTTLLKLLLRFYEYYSGTIHIGTGASGDGVQDLKSVSPSFWRSICGSVMQDGYIFNDTILANIAVGDDEPDLKKVRHACAAAMIHTFIDSLPLGYNTKIGMEGMGVSQGQRQRILIARAIYKDPEYLFFDEATNALDATNERAIIGNLARLFRGKTVIVVAHRLSTVRHADKIIVLEHGQIAEEGNHEQLVAAKGKYYELVKNQLELGN